MSGGLPPRTAVVTFCSVSSLSTYRLLILTPGFCFSYWSTSLVKVLASTPVQPSQTWIEAVLLLPLPPLPPLLLWLSVPQAASTKAPAPSRAAIVTYRRGLAIPSHFLMPFLLLPFLPGGGVRPARSVQVLSNSDHAVSGCQGCQIVTDRPKWLRIR